MPESVHGIEDSLRYY